MDAIKPSRSRAENLNDTDARATIELRAPRSDVNFANLPVSIKLALIVLLLALPLLYFVVQTLQRQNEATRVLTQESKGVAFLNEVSRLSDLLRQHRRESTLTIASDQTMNIVDGIGTQITNEIDRLIAFNNNNKNELAVGSLLDNLKTSWASFRVALPNITADSAFERQTSLIRERYLPILNQTSKVSGLLLDTQLDSALTQNLLVNDLPAVIEAVSQLGGYGEGILKRQTVTPSERAFMAGYLDRANISRDKIVQSIDNIVLARPDLKAQIQTQMQKVVVSSSNVLRRSQFDIVDPPKVFGSPSRYSVLVSNAISSYNELYQLNLATLQTTFTKRTTDVQRTGLTNLLVLLGIFLAVLGFLGIIIRSITTPLNDMNKVVQKFGAGDLSELIPVRSRDELGKLAGSFNNSILQLRDFLGRQEEERQRNIQLQSNIGEFLNVAMDISGGDLTRKGRVTEDVLGNVVDAINLMTEEIGYLLKDVQDATTKVNLGANSVTQVSQGIVAGAQNQTDIARLAQEQTTKVTTSMVQMSDDAQKASLSATQALEASQAGQQAVFQTLEGMQGIRREVQNISKGIKSLSDRSLEISEIVDTISQITRQTNLIALNAAIEASGAGEAGARFAIVADEVRNLAENAAKATLSITGLIKTIQLEVQAAVVGVENGTREVEEGYRIATGAGERLQEISVLTAQSAAFAENIAASTRVQVNQINNVAQAVQEIAGTANQTASDSQQGQVSAQGLVKLSEQLTQSLSRFQLPN